jgi:hypothetical protein
MAAVEGPTAVVVAALMEADSAVAGDIPVTVCRGADLAAAGISMRLGHGAVSMVGACREAGSMAAASADRRRRMAFVPARPPDAG